MITLYDINEMYLRAMEEAQEYAAEHEGIIPDDLALKIDSLDLSREDKIENTVKYIKARKVESEAIKAEEEKLRKRRKSAEDDVEWNKKNLATILGNGNKYKFAAASVYWKTNLSVSVLNQSCLAAEYMKVEYTPRLREIGEALKDGKDLGGAAVLVESQSICIR